VREGNSHGRSRDRSTGCCAVIALVTLLSACNEEIVLPAYETIAGGYSGELAGWREGIFLDATLSMMLTQEGGTLAGTYSVFGTLTNADAQTGLERSGAVAGSIAEGSNPAVDFTLTPETCPTRTETFTGTYDTASGVITVTGNVVLFDSECATLLYYPMLLSLTR
jgi:hypothetical protein